MSIKPLSSYVAVKKEERSEKTPGGLFVPTTVDLDIVKGLVVAVGPGNFSAGGSRLPFGVIVGDRVVFNKHAAIEVKDDAGEAFLLIEEKHLLCVVE